MIWVCNKILKPINLDNEFEACAQLKKRRPKMTPNPHDTKKSRPKSTGKGMVDVIQSMQATIFIEIANKKKEIATPNSEPSSEAKLIVEVEVIPNLDERTFM
ncbi:hypothetical protein IFM89_033632 [Coptis chinensis]|uniref:Uncharacterized protein n=1 Tax=Coptis chinensis TaxID=261450 RepID=A0A835HLG1_9MAGN|nr:hypothetical protein IFM89_033632 [Coptis chinensis]